MNSPDDIDEEYPGDEELRDMEDDAAYDMEWLREKEASYEVYP